MKPFNIFISRAFRSVQPPLRRLRRMDPRSKEEDQPSRGCGAAPHPSQHISAACEVGRGSGGRQVRPFNLFVPTFRSSCLVETLPKHPKTKQLFEELRRSVLSWLICSSILCPSLMVCVAYSETTRTLKPSMDEETATHVLPTPLQLGQDPSNLPDAVACRRP